MVMFAKTLIWKVLSITLFLGWATFRDGSGRADSPEEFRSGAFAMENMPSDERAGGFRRSLLLIGAAGLVAGLLSFGLGEMTYGFFAPDSVPQPLGGGTVMRPSLATIATADSRNS